MPKLRVLRTRRRKSEDAEGALHSSKESVMTRCINVMLGYKCYIGQEGICPHHEPHVRDSYLVDHNISDLYRKCFSTKGEELEGCMCADMNDPDVTSAIMRIKLTNSADELEDKGVHGYAVYKTGRQRKIRASRSST